MEKNHPQPVAHRGSERGSCRKWQRRFKPLPAHNKRHAITLRRPLLVKARYTLFDSFLPPSSLPLPSCFAYCSNAFSSSSFSCGFVIKRGSLLNPLDSFWIIFG
eukprot:GHVT01023688.1.p3 GENE.GHVT01023688.1~~GHVT01023688.1.p3  ORF type:complete len:104 (-),score=14.67 GHVT01023688.1:661-972(-)